ncbi:hypothetical protein Tco_0300506 [Tanacetum coccineum]
MEIPGTLLLVWLLTQDHRALLNHPQASRLNKDTIGREKWGNQFNHELTWGLNQQASSLSNPSCSSAGCLLKVCLYGPLPPMPPPYVNPDNEDGKETEVTKDKVLPSTKDIQPPVNQKSHDLVKPVSSPISPELSFAQVDNSLPSKEPSKKTTIHILKG